MEGSYSVNFRRAKKNFRMKVLIKSVSSAERILEAFLDMMKLKISVVPKEL